VARLNIFGIWYWYMYAGHACNCVSCYLSKRGVPLAKEQRILMYLMLMYVSFLFIEYPMAADWTTHCHRSGSCARPGHSIMGPGEASLGVVHLGVFVPLLTL